MEASAPPSVPGHGDNILQKVGIFPSMSGITGAVFGRYFAVFGDVLGFRHFEGLTAFPW
jgi:hypothetical protein